MSAMVIIPSIASRISPWDAAWREQFERECRAKAKAVMAPPPRTRPLLVIDNARYVAKLTRVAAIMSEA